MRCPAIRGSASGGLTARTAGPAPSRRRGRAARPAMQALADGNAAYERRFGHIYLVCATGRTAPDLLALLTARLEMIPTRKGSRAIRTAEDQTGVRLGTCSAAPGRDQPRPRRRVYCRRGHGTCPRHRAGQPTAGVAVARVRAGRRPAGRRPADRPGGTRPARPNWPVRDRRRRAGPMSARPRSGRALPAVFDTGEISPTRAVDASTRGSRHFRGDRRTPPRAVAAQPVRYSTYRGS